MGDPKRVAVIMAGGSGERFWPLSSEAKPKQLLHLTNEHETLLEEAVKRIEPLVPVESVYVATSEALAPAIREARLPIPDENVLAEPMRRNTAGCLSWVAAELQARHGEEECAELTIGVLTADHQIGKREQFCETVRMAMEAAESFDSLVTIGVRPTRPETGYGYIEAGAKAQPEDHALTVLRFREKPDQAQAEAFLQAGNFYWNSGMFFWRLCVFLRELESASPPHFTAIKGISRALREGNREKAVELFAELPDISIDYALLEKCPHVLMLEADFPWDDVGSWDALERSRKLDERGNVRVGDIALVDTEGCILLNQTKNPALTIGVVGLRDVVVVASPQGILVAAKDRVQDVRQIAQIQRLAREQQKEAGEG